MAHTTHKNSLKLLVVGLRSAGYLAWDNFAFSKKKKKKKVTPIENLNTDNAPSWSVRQLYHKVHAYYGLGLTLGELLTLRHLFSPTQYGQPRIQELIENLLGLGQFR